MNYSVEYMGKQLEELLRILDKANNMMVINMPPDYEGELVKSDVENLMRVSEALGICRKL